MFQAIDRVKPRKVEQPALVILGKEESEKMSLLEIVNRVREGKLKLPPHQRPYVWGIAKRRRWILGLIRAATEGKSFPPNMLATYQLRSTGERFLNDGYQRVESTRKFIEEEYSKYGLTQEQAEAIADAQKVFVANNIYQSHVEGMEDFQAMQLGTGLTPYDFAKGYLEYLDMDTNWMVQLEEFHSFMEFLVRFLKHPKNRRPSDKAKHYRHNYVLLYQWFTGYKSTRFPFADTSAMALRQEDADNKRLVEQYLAKVLGKLSVEDFLKERAALCQFISDETGKILQVWESIPDTKKDGRRYPLVGSIRFLLSVAVWRRNNGLSIEGWEDFLRLFLISSAGSARIHMTDENGVIKACPFGSGRLHLLGQISRMIGYPAYTRVD